MMPQETDRKRTVVIAVVAAITTVLLVVIAAVALWPAAPARQPGPNEHDTSGTSVERPSTSRWPDERVSSAQGW
jgi:hypothetical protein